MTETIKMAQHARDPEMFDHLSDPEKATTVPKKKLEDDYLYAMDEFLALEKPLPPTSVRSMRTCTIDYFGWETSDIFSLQISGVKKNDECPDGDLKTSGHFTETLYSLNLDPNNFDNAAFTELVHHFFGLNLENENDVATIKRMIDFGMLLELDENHVPLVRFPFLQMPASRFFGKT